MAPRAAPSPRSLVRREVWRALGAGALLPARAFGYLAARRRNRAEISGLLGSPAALAPEPAIPSLPKRPLRIFVSCAETSGETHAVSLVVALRAAIERRGGPPPEVSGLGGVRLEALGVRQVGRPVERAAMGFRGPFDNLSYYADLLRRCAEHMAETRPDVCVPVDSPALHVPLARIARAHGIPVAHFVTPQYWGWAPWRAAGYRACVDRALSILPFEPAWFERRGIAVAHVGHPLLDALASVPTSRPREDARHLMLLPGSRLGVIEQNLPWMLAAAARLRMSEPEARAVIVHERRELAEPIEAAIDRAGAGGWARVETGDLHGTLASARCALSVSGTVLLDLLHHRIPAVVLYRLSNSRTEWASRRFLTVPWFSSVNLLVGREVYPEFAFHGDGPVEAIDAALRRAWGDAAWRAECVSQLDRASALLGPPGACDRAALQVLDLALRGKNP
ncbi:MAG: lipid-A-disaccharide synthase [Planctomycetota bacterium]